MAISCHTPYPAESFVLFQCLAVGFTQGMAHDHLAISKEKSLLRKKIRAQLNTLTENHISTSSETICNHITEQFSLRGVTTIFSANGPEVDLSSLHQLSPSTPFVYPLCRPGSQLTFHLVSDPSELNPGMLGIGEPTPDQHPEVPIGEIDLFLCPGLAFGRNGTRLGHGGGYYDRMLAKRNPSTEAWGIGMEIQLLDSVATDAHDQLLHGVITESGVTHPTPD